ncbi:MAG: nicotinate (nicotinamide) nucleotide adenylyltransferase [Magnetococcales bacterium]|nr:nicotinate (nicotinamide) nucleotide adenylyltransferase [Magnetococcales bacterium]
MAKKKTGLLGGAFSPPHFGHLRPAREAMLALGLERVVLIPSGTHPFKGRDVLAPANRRLEMVRLAVAGQPEFDVWEIEVARSGISYTIETVTEWHRRWPDEEPVLLVGSDLLHEWHLWRAWQKIIEHTHICLLTRPGHPWEASNAPALAWLRRFQVTQAEALDFQNTGRYGFFVQPVTLLEISSTELRRRLRAGESLHGLTPDPVIEYLTMHAIYQEQKLWQ